MNPEQAARGSLGGNSHDEERGNTSQRRTLSSSGFLVDSFIPRSKSLRTSNQQTRRSELDHRWKRPTSEAEAAPKKRSRFPWGRHRESAKESEAISQGGDDYKETTRTQGLSEDISVPESQGESAGNHTPRHTENRGDRAATPGLDKDSLQIVNLALNLSESRKRGSAGYADSNRISSGGTWVSSGNGRISAAGSIPSQGSFPGHDARQSIGDDRLNTSMMRGVSDLNNEVWNSLPTSAASESVPQGFSGATLARAANARRYFELRLEYLRLIPSLPPLRPCGTPATDVSQSLDSYPSHRVYNPLQAIRNRKVRFRERCPIDTDADGWNDVDKVHNWVNSVEAAYRRQARSPLECLNLPPFPQETRDTSLNKGVETVDATHAASPPSSLRRISRTSSTKARRPRSDWMIDPDELLADAAWVEDAQNKSRLVDKDGNALYPSPASLVVDDVHREEIQGKGSASTGRPSSQISQSDARRSLSIEVDDYGRGRQLPSFKTPQRVGSSSVSAQDSGRKRHRLRMRPRSSSGSSTDETPLSSRLRSPRRSVSPLRRKGTGRSEKGGSLSSAPSADGRYGPRSLETDGRGYNTTTDVHYFPGIATNLSVPSSRSSSPAKRGFSRTIGSRRTHSRSSFHRKGADDDSSVDFDATTHKDSIPLTEPAPQHDTEEAPLPVKAVTYHYERPPKSNAHERKDSVQNESKLRGIFKGPGKIAGKVGNEVSKMGDFILGKDGVAHTRKSSAALSEESEVDEEEIKSEKRAIPKTLLRRLPPFSDDPGRGFPKHSDKALAKNITQEPPIIIEPGRQCHNELSFAGSEGQLLDLQGDSGSAPGPRQGNLAGTFMPRGPRHLHLGPDIHTVRDEIRKGRIRDDSVPFSMARPPITGLAQAQATPELSSHDRRLPLPSQTRSWSISDRSVSISVESGVPGKREVERTRALLLSSGIKAREIVRRAESVRMPPADFLQRAFGPDAKTPSVPRLYEHEVASRMLLKRIDASHRSFENMIEHAPEAAFSPLESRLSTLEDLVNQSLNHRVRAAAEEAESLSTQLNTTGTLTVKQLSETLDHGLRKRGRRLRWLRRTGFVVLEWALIGLLWWVWLIVVAFKLFRKLLCGIVSGVKWILWL
ncbi:hypothetical protein BJX61DRAFT_100757 [Aspergillus egyptiacus]|nr:hypothetical protein BJX61DRAFT_100757 [Aspergillus egyptiacus]